MGRRRGGAGGSRLPRIGGPTEILNDHFTQNLIREVQRDHWEGSKPPRDTPRTCVDRTSDRGQVGRSATHCRAGKIRDFGAHGTQLIYLLVVDVSSQVAGPGTILGSGALTYHKILIYNTILTCPKHLKSHIDTRPPKRVASQMHHNASMHTAPQACCTAPIHSRTDRRRQGGQGKHADIERCTRASSVAFESLK